MMMLVIGGCIVPGHVQGASAQATQGRAAGLGYGSLPDQLQDGDDRCEDPCVRSSAAVQHVCRQRRFNWLQSRAPSATGMSKDKDGCRTGADGYLLAVRGAIVPTV
jgi:hypothetical protein